MNDPTQEEKTFIQEAIGIIKEVILPESMKEKTIFIQEILKCNFVQCDKEEYNQKLEELCDACKKDPKKMAQSIVHWLENSQYFIIPSVDYGETVLGGSILLSE